jgi:hypothetical protein
MIGAQAEFAGAPYESPLLRQHLESEPVLLQSHPTRAARRLTPSRNRKPRDTPSILPRLESFDCISGRIPWSMYSLIECYGIYPTGSSTRE